MTRVAYFVHDVNDPAVARRTQMLRAAGADVIIAGFRRDDRLPATVSGAQVVDLGRTGDARLVQRALAVARNLIFSRRLRAVARGADVIVGRNLEALALATYARRGVTGARLVYECLDIHRSLLGKSAGARAIQAIEARLLAGSDLLIVSSPAFLANHFANRPTFTAPSILVENKWLDLGGTAIEPPVHIQAGPPWVIGWFGNLRCSRTLQVLGDLASRMEGRIEVLIAGRPSPAVFNDFAASVAALPHCAYVGPYTASDLPVLYARCHFAWAIDWFEDGLNSSWLLPNRLYEAAYAGAVPIADANVETGRWLARHGAGVLVDADHAARQLEQRFNTLSGPAYDALRNAVSAIERDDIVADRKECEELLAALARA